MTVLSCLNLLNPTDHHPRPVGDPGVVQRLVDRLVGVAMLDVLAHDGNPHLVVGVADAVDQLSPVGHPALETVRGRRARHLLSVTTADNAKARSAGKSSHHRRDGIRVRVRPAHHPVAGYPDSHLWRRHLSNCLRDRSRRRGDWSENA